MQSLRYEMQLQFPQSVRSENKQSVCHEPMIMYSRKLHVQGKKITVPHFCNHLLGRSTNWDGLCAKCFVRKVYNRGNSCCLWFISSLYIKVYLNADQFVFSDIHDQVHQSPDFYNNKKNRTQLSQTLVQDDRAVPACEIASTAGALESTQVSLAFVTKQIIVRNS